MTDNEKKQIESYRKNGYGYKQISNLSISAKSTRAIGCLFFVINTEKSANLLCFSITQPLLFE